MWGERRHSLSSSSLIELGVLHIVHCMNYNRLLRRYKRVVSINVKGYWGYGVEEISNPFLEPFAPLPCNRG